MDLNRNMTNEQLLANTAVKQALEDGKLVLIDKVPTANPEYTNLYFIGKVTGLASSNTDVSELAAVLLGWNNSAVYMRSIQNASTAIASQMQIGQQLPGTIKVVDSLEKSFDEQTPRIDRNGAQLLNNGKPIYRNTQICTHEEFEAQGHSTLEVTERIGTQQPSQPVNAGQQSSQQVVGQGDTTPNPQQGASIGNLIGGQA